MAKELDEKGFVFVGKDGNAYRCCMWGSQAWLFRWRDGEKCFESIRPLTQMDVWALPRNLTDEQQELYFKLEAQTARRLLPYTNCPQCLSGVMSDANGDEDRHCLSCGYIE